MNNRDKLMYNITFKKANKDHQAIIFLWLNSPHIIEFWDNSQEHKDDIINFINGRKESSNYFDGVISYWVGLINNEPYCFILTSEETGDDEAPEIIRESLSKTGKTYCIDFGIGNEDYLGKGLASLTLEAFTKFFQSKIDQTADTFFIDPDDNNPRAQHVYEKAGFKKVGEFQREGRYHDFSGDKTFLMVKKMII